MELDDNENFNASNFILSPAKTSGGLAVFTRETKAEDGSSKESIEEEEAEEDPKETIRRLREEKAALESRNDALESRNHELHARIQQLESSIFKDDSSAGPPSKKRRRYS